MMRRFWRIGRGPAEAAGHDVDRISAGKWDASRPVEPVVLWALIVLGVLLAGVNFLPWIAMRFRIRVATFLLRLAMLGVLLLVLCGIEFQAIVEMNEKQQWVVPAIEGTPAIRPFAIERPGGRSPDACPKVYG